MDWWTNWTIAQTDAPPPPPAGESQAVEGAEGTPQAPAPGPEHQPSPWGLFLPLILILVIFWVLIFLPKRREDKRRRELLSSLKKGDRVQTIGGILGTLVELRENEVILKVDESSNVRLRLNRSAIQAVLSDGKPPE